MYCSSVVRAEMLPYTWKMRAYSEERTEAGYIFFVLWERYCANRIRSVSKHFRLCSIGGTLSWIPSVKKNDLVLYMLFA